MDKGTAERWVTISALVVAGIYAYRRLTESTSPSSTGLKNLLGVGGLPPLGIFITAWGFTFLVISIMAEAAPGLGGSFAILVGTGDVLTNSSSVFADVGKQEGSTSTTTSTATAATVAGQASPSHGLATTGLAHGAGTITP